MLVYSEDEFLALSGIQHYSFCKRQWALIHIEQIWKDNLLTTQGEIMHERAHDEGLREHRGDVIIVRGLTVRSSSLGVLGKCDVVEFHRDEKGHPLRGEEGLWSALPVEYKHGRPKESDADRLQLCVQAMSLEEMLVSSIEYGCLYYGSTHARERVEFTQELRSAAEKCLGEMHELYRRQLIPRAHRTRACASCSLVEQCVPKKVKQVDDYIDEYVGRSE